MLAVGGQVLDATDPAALRVLVPADRRLELLGLIASHGAGTDPRLRQIAAPIVAEALRRGRGKRGALAALLAVVQARVQHVDEDPEWFVWPWNTWDLGWGDCDDSAVLLAALAASCALPARLVELASDDGTQGHVCAQLAEHEGSPWLWAEASVTAYLGEHPQAAAARLLR